MGTRGGRQLIADLIANYDEFRRAEALFLAGLQNETLRGTYLAARSGHRAAVDELRRLATRHLDRGLRPLTDLEREARQGVLLLECLALFTGSE
jgi:hypothetical protein